MMPPTNDVSAFGRYAPHGAIAVILRLTRLRPIGWLGQRFGFVCRTLGILLLRGRPLDVSALGARMRLYPAHNTSEKKLLFTPHLFDPEERDMLARYVRDGFVFVDVGANVGGYALFVAALAGPKARVLAVEPQPELFERLVFNIRQNPFGTVKALECAVTDKDGTVTLFVDPSNSGRSSVRFVNSSRQFTALKVSAKTLKTIVDDEQLDRIDAMKVDVEGAENLILEPFFSQVDQSLWPRLLILDDPAEGGPRPMPALAEGGQYELVGRTRNNSLYALRELSAADPSEAGERT
jgi:FkbM family methyltransferase